ncbi:nucleoside diphosphate kinase regulator [Denitratisoma oestradiolicum]|nr:nucleoside diphosphate kinase regulator [Denitratisoma oestradiolicum]TWO82296.1 transcription elongation factor GreAB [Denitratisoma oestradiolicum]
MRHENTTTRPHNDALVRNTGDLVISDDDYVRLRKIVGEHDLAEELDRAIVVPAERIRENTVTMHSRLIYRDESTGTTREVELVYPDEADSMAGRVSVLAPVGCALLGLSAGQSIDWNLPGGKVHRLRVERVLFQPRPGDSGSAAAKTR